MHTKIQILAASAIACLVSGCVIPDPYYVRPVHHARPVYTEEIYVPQFIVVEHGVRHDRYYYQRHPEAYHRDRLRYPERFAPVPPPRHDFVYRRPVAAPQVVVVNPTSNHGPAARPQYVGRPSGHHGPAAAPQVTAPQAAVARPGAPVPPEDPKAKKKKHGEDDRDRDGKPLSR